jgi:hypothetical protein
MVAPFPAPARVIVLPEHVTSLAQVTVDAPSQNSAPLDAPLTAAARSLPDQDAGVGLGGGGVGLDVGNGVGFGVGNGVGCGVGNRVGCGVGFGVGGCGVGNGVGDGVGQEQLGQRQMHRKVPEQLLPPWDRYRLVESEKQSGG